jgi:uncharacterized repeat protein (TIGR01451 family)
MKQVRLGWLAGTAAAAILITLAALINPVQIEITIAPRASAALAGLATVTPLPPTHVPPTEAPPTATPPTPTQAPASTQTPAPETPRRERIQPTPVVASVTPALPPAAEERRPQLTIVKRAMPAVARPGDRVSFDVDLVNRGDAPALDLVIIDEVPLPLRVVDLLSTKGDIVVEGQRVSAFPRTLDPGESARITIVAEIPPDAPAGPIANTAVVTSSSPDDPGDNTSTTIVEIQPIAQGAPPRLPTTADPTEVMVLVRYWPLLALAFGAMLLGAFVRAGAFRQRTLHVTLASSAADRLARPSGLVIDTDSLHARWLAGASTHDLVVWAVGQNPDVDRLTISLAIQQLLRAAVKGRNA